MAKTVIIRRDRESSLKRRVMAAAVKEFGLHSIRLDHDGWNDQLILIPGGRPLFAEFKVKGEEPRVLQVRRHDTLGALGYDVVVWDDYETAMADLRKRVT
jgi:hypothetical protein